MAGFDYWHTCPIIDRSIGSLQEDIRRELSDLMDNTGMTAEEIKPLLDDYTGYIYSSNEDMRKEAEKQIADIEYDKDEAESMVSELKSDVDDLENQLEEARAEVEQYKEQAYEYDKEIDELKQHKLEEF